MRHSSPPGDTPPSCGGPGRRKRLFDYGEIRLLILALIAERSRHGYEIIKDIEERFQGRYSPSPGVIYPTLAWLEDMGYATVEPEGGGRKRMRITPEGEAFLTANRAAAEDLLTRAPPGPPPGIAPEILAAMDRLKAALRASAGSGPDRIATIAATIDAAADAINATADAPDEQG